MKHYLTDEEALLRDLKATKHNYQLDDCPKTSKYVGKCIKAIKWCRKNNIRGAKRYEVLGKLTPENFQLYTKRHK